MSLTGRKNFKCIIKIRAGVFFTFSQFPSEHQEATLGAIRAVAFFLPLTHSVNIGQQPQPAFGRADNVLRKMKVGDKIVCCIGCEVKIATIGSKSNHWLYAANGKPICMEVIAEPYTPANMLAAMRERNESSARRDKELIERYLQDFTTEAARDDRHEGVNAQLEATDREYRPVSIHAA